MLKLPVGKALKTEIATLPLLAMKAYSGIRQNIPYKAIPLFAMKAYSGICRNNPFAIIGDENLFRHLPK